MSTNQGGGCACGAIRFTLSAEPLFVGHCHCKDCQKMTGAHMATVAGIPADAFTVNQGQAKVYDTIGDSGSKVHRHFCGNCGSTLYSTGDSMPGVVFVEAGALDDASGWKPGMHIYTRSAQPWANIPADMPSFPTMPPAEG